MKVDITLTLDAALMREILVLAEEEGMSLSAFLTAHIEQAVGRRKTYERARGRALARLRNGFDLQWTPPRSRDELHEQ